MPSAQTLTTNILINASTGNGFSKVGNTLTELGSIVNGLSSELINFGKDSIDVYRNYEKSMRDAEVALSTTYGRGTSDLAGVMSQLDVSATEWAATTIFHTNDVANAISEAAHAGWDYDQIMSGIPAAMQLAQAGSLDLSEAVNYIVKSTTAAGIGFEDLGNFTDLWTFAANSSASTIGEFGDAMLRMGSTMRFAANPEELMTLIAVTANAGATGSEAGTMIRNSMMRLIAPTKKAKDAMAELGATSEESAALLDDESLAAANARLEAVGFSAYDEKGNLKSILDTYSDLYVALGEVAGGYDNIAQNKDALEVLSAIFPTRTIQEALTLLRGASDEYGGLYDAMQNGAAEGYGAYAAETMMDSLDGKIETFESKVERLKQLVGEELSDQLEDVLGGVGGMIDQIANMDEGNFSALVSGLEVVAAAGPAILATGSAFRLIGKLFGSLGAAGGIALGATALVSIVSAVRELEDANFSDLFGAANIDHAAIYSHLQEIGAGFDEARAKSNEYRDALAQNVKDYESASNDLSSRLLTDVLTGATLSDSDITALQGLGEKMHESVIQGLENSKNASASYWEMFFGGADEAQGNDTFADIIDLENSAYSEAVAQAESIGQGIRDAMTAAFADGQISNDEYQNILSYVQSYNEAIARAETEAKDRQDYIDRQSLLHKGQTASLDEIKDVEKEIKEARDQRLEEDQSEYLKQRYGSEYDWNQAIESGRDVGGKPATAERRDAALAEMDRQQEQRQMQIRSGYDDTIFQLWDTNARQSKLGDAYKQLEELSSQVLSGQTTTGEAVSQFAQSYDKRTRDQLQEVLAHETAGYGGYEGLESRISAARESGNTQEYQRLGTLYGMDQLNSNFARTSLPEYESGIFGTVERGIDRLLGNRFSTTNAGDYAELSQYQRSRYEETLGLNQPAQTQQPQQETVSGYLPILLQALGRENTPPTTQQPATPATAQPAAAPSADVSAIQSQGPVSVQVQPNINTADMSAAMQGQQVQVDVGANTEPMKQDIDASVTGEEYKLPLQLDQSNLQLPSSSDIGGDGLQITAQINPDGSSVQDFLNGNWRINATPEIDESGLSSLGPYPVTIEPRMEGVDPAEQLQSQGVQVDVSGDTQSLTATIDAENGKQLLEYVNGNAANLEMSIRSQDGKTLTENVHGNVSSLRSAIDSQNGRTITVNIRGNRLFASGGRATSASIFGEAGPEWAIPEEHSERTAQLLDSARAASGFTWPELLARVGGLNANIGSPQSTIVYSPTINAADATGVERVLEDDKDRLDRWYRERQMMDKLEVYA